MHSSVALIHLCKVVTASTPPKMGDESVDRSSDHRSSDQFVRQYTVILASMQLAWFGQLGTVTPRGAVYLENFLSVVVPVGWAGKSH